MTPIAVKDLLEAGVHFGHQTKRWNPKMKPFIFGERNGIYIIDLGKTARLFKEAEQFVTRARRRRAARCCSSAPSGRRRTRSAEEAQRCGMFYVNERWLGGLLTNFSTIQRSLGRLRDLEAMVTDGRYDSLSKKEIARLEKEKRKLQKNLDGIRNMGALPDALFVVDTKHEQIAVDEARKLKIPVIGVVDTNCDPDQVDFVDPRQRRRAARDSAVHVARRRRGHRRPRRARVGDRRAPTPAARKAADDRGRRQPPVARQRRADERRHEAQPATTPASV